MSFELECSSSVGFNSSNLIPIETLSADRFTTSSNSKDTSTSIGISTESEGKYMYHTPQSEIIDVLLHNTIPSLATPLQGTKVLTEPFKLPSLILPEPVPPPTLSTLPKGEQKWSYTRHLEIKQQVPTSVFDSKQISSISSEKLVSQYTPTSLAALSSGLFINTFTSMS